MKSLNRAISAGLLLSAACGSPSGENSTPRGTAVVSLVHAAAGTPALDLLVDGQVVLQGVPYSHRSTAVDAPSGARSIALRPAGSSTPILTRQLTLGDGGHYALVAGGTGTALTLTTSVTVDTGVARPDRGNLRIINIGAWSLPADSASLPPADLLAVVITAPGAPLAGAPTQLSLDARFSSYSSLLYFDPGSYVVRFVRPGTSAVVAESAEIPLGAGQVRAVTLQKLPDGSYVTTVVVEG